MVLLKNMSNNQKKISNKVDNNQLKINFSSTENGNNAKVVSINYFENIRNQRITSMILKTTKSF